MPNLANQDFTQFKREQQTAPAWFRILRGGRMTKWKGKVASYAPHVAPAIGWAFSRTLQLSLISLVMAGTAAASDRYWDSNGTAVGRGGSGAWNTSNAFWSQAAMALAVLIPPGTTRRSIRLFSVVLPEQ